VKAPMIRTFAFGKFKYVGQVLKNGCDMSFFSSFEESAKEKDRAQFQRTSINNKTKAFDC